MLGFPASAVQRCLEAGVNAECCLCCVLHGRCVCVCVCVLLSCLGGLCPLGVSGKGNRKHLP